MKGKVYVTWECTKDNCERTNSNHPTHGQRSTGNPTLDPVVARKSGRDHMKRIHGDYTSEPKIIVVKDAQNVKLYGNSGKFRRDIVGKKFKASIEESIKEEEVLAPMEQDSDMQKV